MSNWIFPFQGKELLGATSDSFSFRNIDIRSQVEIPIPPHPGGFGVERRYDVHAGVDLYCEQGEAVYAVEAGRIISIEQFTGPEVGCPWWEVTMAVLVEGASGIVVYGEIEPEKTMRVSAHIAAGEFLGRVMTVLKKDKGRPRNMLHLELHCPRGIFPVLCPYDELAARNALCNPTPYLLNAEQYS